MSQANRNLVADALESGEFEQGRGALCRGGFHCCLGVACEIYQRHVGDLEIRRTIKGNTTYNCAELSLPKKVQEWLDFRTHTGKFESDILTVLNDRGTPFTEIAKLFREPPEGLCCSHT